jgi:hypothetical protein
MPIHDQSYRRYKGERENLRSAWTVIALTGIKSFIKNRALLGVLLVAYIPFIVRIVQFRRPRRSAISSSSRTSSCS